MATLDVEIKTEPLDDNCNFYETELDIKTEIEDETDNMTLDCKIENTLDQLIPKEEPMDEEMDEEISVLPLQEQTNKPRRLPQIKSSFVVIRCDICSLFFNSEIALSVHKRSHCRTSINCSNCEKTFHSELMLKVHMESKHRNQNSKKSPKKQHKTIKPTKLFHCKTCGVKFSSRDEIRKHMKIHSKIKHICNQCGKSFDRISDFKKHKRGDTCTKETIAEFLNSAINDTEIKEEIESENELLTEEMLEEFNKERKIASDTTNNKDVPNKAFYELKNPKEDTKSNLVLDNTFHMINGKTLIASVGSVKAACKIVNSAQSAFVGKKNTVVTKSDDFEAFAQQMLKGFTTTPEKKSHQLQIKAEPICEKQNDNESKVETKPIITVKPLIEVQEIKEEPKSSDDEDSIEYNTLLLEELCDRKIKSLAKIRKTTTVENISPYHNILFDHNYFKKDLFTPIPSKTNIYSKTELKNRITSLSEAQQPNNNNDHCSNIKTEIIQENDFEDMINFSFVTKSNHIICKLKDEYQKASMKKPTDDISTDETSQNELIDVKPSRVGPISLYFSLKNVNAFSRAVRNLDKDYRYVWCCPWCFKQYLYLHRFKDHLYTNHDNEKNLNELMYEVRPELKECNNRTDDFTYCPLCRVSLVDAETLQKHYVEFHKEDSIRFTNTKFFKCEKCGKYCSTKGNLIDHIKGACGTAPQFGCEVCGKKFHTKSTLNLHRTMHTGVLPHSCSYCTKRFRTRGQLTVHTRTHTGEKPFPCKVCHQRFTHRETLISHLSRHIDMKRYKCYVCDKQFACISGLKTHREVRPDTCGKVKLNSRPIGPRVRVIKGNVIFEPQPLINPYARRKEDDVGSNLLNDSDQGETKKYQENLSKAIIEQSKSLTC